MNQFIKETDTVHAGEEATGAAQTDRQGQASSVKTGADLLISLLKEAGV